MVRNTDKYLHFHTYREYKEVDSPEKATIYSNLDNALREIGHSQPNTSEFLTKCYEIYEKKELITELPFTNIDLIELEINPTSLKNATTVYIPRIKDSDLYIDFREYTQPFLSKEPERTKFYLSRSEAKKLIDFQEEEFYCYSNSHKVYDGRKKINKEDVEIVGVQLEFTPLDKRNIFLRNCTLK